MAQFELVSYSQNSDNAINTISIKTIIMKKQFINSLLTIAALACLQAKAATIPMQSINQDISFLADDELQGRQVFTKEIDQAANYIADRFKQAGLKPFQSTYKQEFAIFAISPEEVYLTLNGEEISSENIALASTAREINWTKDSDVSTHTIGKDQNLRQTLSTLNLEGGNHLVLIDKNHEKLFKRYQNYFNRGLTKLEDSNTGTIVLALTSVTEISTFNVTAKTKLTPKSLTNVVGVLPGKLKNSEVVLYTAHYDHLGTKLTKSDDDDSVYNGADDNASGVTGVLNLAQHFAKKKNNDRTLIFVAFTAEEIGGWGSKYFSQQLPADDVVAMINLEMIGKVSKFGAGRLWMTGMERSNLGEIMNQALIEKTGTQTPLIEKDPYPKQQLFYRSDNATLARLGVPAHSFSTVQLAQDKHYHALSDELGTINLPSLKKVVETIAVASSTLISGKATPSRVDTSKVTASGKIY